MIEANRVGWGASGRNGGQLHSGQRRDQETLEKWFGADKARLLFDLAQEAKATVKDLIATHAIDCDWRDGLIHAVHKRRYIAEIDHEIDHLQKHYGYDAFTASALALAPPSAPTSTSAAGATAPPATSIRWTPGPQAWPAPPEP